MSRPNPTVLFGFFVAVIVAMCGVSLMKGGLYLGKHEGDTLHLMQIVLRMADGEWPHLDFMSPIGVLAFAPIAWFVRLGYGAGSAIILAQTLVAVVLLPALWWTAFSRMRGLLPYLFGLIVIVLITALVHGEAQRSVSISMHYNRWAWAVAFIAIALAVIPARVTPRQNLDGIIIGLALAVLVLSKVTYFVAFIIPIVLSLLMYRSFRTLYVAAGTGLVVLLAVTLMAGFGFWGAYTSDLMLVALGGVRAAPGEPLAAVVGAPAYIGGSLTLLGGVILLRQAEKSVAGLLLLTLVPGFFYVSYQNFANDPQWLLLLGVLLIAFLPEAGLKNGFGWDMRSALGITAAAAFAFSAPSFLNLAYSPFRHARLIAEDYVPLLPASKQHSDLLVVNIRALRVDARIAFDEPGSGLEAYAEFADREEIGMVNGEALPQCTVELGIPSWFDAIASDLEMAGLADGKQIFTADILSSAWLFSSLQPLTNGTPWYYGGLPGFVNSDYVLVPLCPLLPSVRRQILETIEDRDITLTEIRRTPLYILFTHDQT